MNEPMAKAIAKWWADRVREGVGNPWATYKPEVDYPDAEQSAGALMDVVQCDVHQYGEEIDRFEQELADLILKPPNEIQRLDMIGGLEGWPDNFDLRVDWDPDALLHIACLMSKMPTHILPFHTKVVVRGDTARVTRGVYKTKHIWPPE